MRALLLNLGLASDAIGDLLERATLLVLERALHKLLGHDPLPQIVVLAVNPYNYAIWCSPT
ncbi:MAG TPA: hypothetical protein VNY30_00455 [Bryobacteraceae bacterium]|nr:hypothetical protein [Bryobacteraceae bacterium]